MHDRQDGANHPIGTLLALPAILDGLSMDRRAELDLKDMDKAVVEKTWQIPAHGGKGPVTVMVRMPEVTITDSQGRHIVISPEQAELVGGRLEDISWWIHDGASDDGDAA